LVNARTVAVKVVDSPPSYQKWKNRSAMFSEERRESFLQQFMSELRKKDL